MDPNEESIEEIKRLKDLSIQKIREPIKRSKAQIQTLFINNNGYAWHETASSVIIRVNFIDADKISVDDCSLNTTTRSVEFNIFNHKNAHHKFTITQLYSFIHPEKSRYKLKKDKIVINLTKQNDGTSWLDLRMKTIQNTYQGLERSINTSSKEGSINYDTPFKESNCCSHTPPHYHEEHK
ncbi:hypothetical protein BD408DRAFT_375714 [Parasitella parasitica]|nr:hypothetical protein BD408DRAFT_375714 [Parasitella parasitica]